MPSPAFSPLSPNISHISNVDALLGVNCFVTMVLVGGGRSPTSQSYLGQNGNIFQGRYFRCWIGKKVMRQFLTINYDAQARQGNCFVSLHICSSASFLSTLVRLCLPYNLDWFLDVPLIYWIQPVCLQKKVRWQNCLPHICNFKCLVTEVLGGCWAASTSNPP